MSSTGRSWDGGNDGAGTYRLSLTSSRLFFQFKRDAGSVGASAVRDFRGAMTGRGDKGLVFTTGTFTADAKFEATRDGAPPVDLSDGVALCEPLKQHELGTKLHQVEQGELLRDFFEQSRTDADQAGDRVCGVALLRCDAIQARE